MSNTDLNLKKGVASVPETLRDSSLERLRQRIGKNKWLMGSLVAIPIVGIGGYLAYHQLVTVPQQEAQNKIQTAPVARDNLTIVVSANGTVQPESSVNVSPKTSGVLKQLLVKEGDFVQSGQNLVRSGFSCQLTGCILNKQVQSFLFLP